MNTVLLPRPLLADPPEPCDGMSVSEADYWDFYYLGHEVTYEWNLRTHADCAGWDCPFDGSAGISVASGGCGPGIAAGDADR